jgi:hypothetical protein
MAKDFLASQLRTNQIIASRSLGVQPSLLVISASNAGGTGTVTPGIPAGADAFVFISGSRGSDAFVVLGGSAKISGSLSVFDDVNLGQTTADTISFLGRVGTGIFPTADKSYQLGQNSLQWSRVFAQTGSFDFISSSDNGVFFKGLSGSIQRTATGVPYLNAGTGISISTASNGQITITSTAAAAGGIDTQVQFNDLGILEGDDGLTYNKTTKTLKVGNLLVTGSVTAVSTSNLTISDAVIYLASGSAGPNVRSVIAFASGSSSTDKSLIFGSLGANDTIVAARQDVSGGIIAQSNLSFSDLVPIRASKFEIGTSIALTSSDGQSAILYSAGSGFISIVPGSVGLKLGNAGAPVAISGSNVRFGNTSSEFSGEIPPQPGADSYYFVSGGINTKDSGYRGVAVFGGDVVISGSLYGGSPLNVKSPAVFTTGISGSLTQLFDGSSYLVAGTNVTITSASNGSVVISSTGGGGGSSYFTDPIAGKLNTTGSLSLAGNLGTSHTTQNVGTDVFFFVSGTLNTASKSVFGGGVVISGSLAQGRLNIASGQYSHAEGWANISSGQYSHAEGTSTIASGLYSHAEGNDTEAGGEGAHAEGDRASAAGNYSHAAGLLTVASGSYSYVGGLGTISSGSYQHVFGKYNKREDSSSLFIVGNGLGDDDSNRSDVLRVLSGTLNNGRVEIVGSADIKGTLLVSGTTHLGDSAVDSVFFNARLATNLIPDADVSRNLGSATNRFANIYTGDLHLRNDRGDYTLIEEEDCLTIRFNKTGKRYRFLLERAPEYDETDT